MILLSVFSSLQIWDSLPKPAEFFTSFCGAYFSWLGGALWVSSSTICFLGAQRTFESFNVTLHSLLSLMFFHLFFPVVSHDLSLPFHLCLFLLLISPFFLCFSPSSFLLLIPISSRLLSYLLLLFHRLHLLPSSPFSRQFSVPFPYFSPSTTTPASSLSLFRSSDSWPLCITETLPHAAVAYGTWIFIQGSLCHAYYALCPVIILFLRSCHLCDVCMKTGVWML